MAHRQCLLYASGYCRGMDVGPAGSKARLAVDLAAAELAREAAESPDEPKDIQDERDLIGEYVTRRLEEWFTDETVMTKLDVRQRKTFEAITIEMARYIGKEISRGDHRRKER